MAKRNYSKQKHKRPAIESPTGLAANTLAGDTTKSHDDGSPNKQALSHPPQLGRWAVGGITLAVVFHFSALLTALASNLTPSYLQGEIMHGLSAYLVPLHQSYGALPLEWTHASNLDFPVRLEIREQGQSSWRDATPSAATRWPQISRILTLITEDQPDSEVLSEIAFQFVRQFELREQQQVAAIRWIQPHVNSFDEDLLIAAQQTVFIEDNLQPEILFAARVVRDGKVAQGLVPELEASRTALPVGVSEADVETDAAALETTQ